MPPPGRSSACVRRRPAARRGPECTPWLHARPGPPSWRRWGPGDPAPGGALPAAAAQPARPGCSPPRRRAWRGRGRRTGGPRAPATTRVATSARPGPAGRRDVLHGHLPPVAGVGQDDPAHAAGRPAVEALARERALREDEDVVGDVDDRLACPHQVAVGARLYVRPDHQPLLTPEHAHGREVGFSVLVQRRHDGLDDHWPRGSVASRRVVAWTAVMSSRRGPCGGAGGTGPASRHSCRR